MLKYDLVFNFLGRRLNQLEKPQRYLEKRINISRATIYRLLKKDANLDFSTFFKLIDWLSEEPETYIKLKKEKNHAKTK